jgi:hypothetical protein
MLEVTPNTAITIAKALRSQATGIQVAHRLEESQALQDVSHMIIDQITDYQDEYPGKLYDIWAKGKRRAHLGYKREPDIRIGNALGKNFLDACIHYCSCIMFCNGAYNPKDNTLGGYVLYTKECKEDKPNLDRQIEF